MKPKIDPAAQRAAPPEPEEMAAMLAAQFACNHQALSDCFEMAGELDNYWSRANMYQIAGQLIRVGVSVSAALQRKNAETAKTIGSRAKQEAHNA